MLDEETRARLPPLYSQEGLGLEAVALVKFFTLDSTWTYWVSEGSPVGENGHIDTDKIKAGFILFGLVNGQVVEFGYFPLSELDSARGPLGLPIERDLHYRPKTLRELMEALGDDRE